MRRFIILSSLILASCGGSGGSNSDKDVVVFEGMLTQGEAATHSERVKHGANEGIEEVSICALGKCSKTDSKGNFGMGAPESYAGGDVEFSISGHFTEAKRIVKIPQGVKSVFIHFEKQSETEVEIHHLIIDDIESTPESGHHAE